MQITQSDLELLKTELRKDTTAQGLFSSSGVSAIHLDEFVKLLYPIFYPNLQKFPHISPEMAGQKWGGTSFQWRALVDPNATSLPAPVSEGNTNAISSQTLASFASSYTSLGYDQSVSFEEQEYARGLDDAMNLARITTVHNILKEYDKMTTNGNRGAANNGFALGTANAAVLGASATTGGAIADSTKVTIFVVGLTAAGLAANSAASTGIASKISRTPANTGVAEVIPAGVGIVSLTSNSVTTGSSGSNANTVAWSVVPKNGEMGYAVYVSSNGSPTAANAPFAFVSNTPGGSITALPTAGNQKANATDLATDYSFNDGIVGSANAPDFDGAFSWLFASQGGSRPAQLVNLGNKTLTASGTGTVTEIDKAIAAQFKTYQAVPDRLVCGMDMIEPLTNAAQSGSSNLRFNVETGPDGQIRGGQVIKEYRLKFSPDGMARILPVEVSPNIPANAIWLPSMNNPFPSTSATVPNVLELAEIRPMYSLNYAFTSRQYRLGTYVQTTLVNRAPQLGILLTGGKVA